MISAARPGARRETETYPAQIKTVRGYFKRILIEKSFAIQQAGRFELWLFPEQVSDADMVLMHVIFPRRLKREMEYPGQIKVKCNSGKSRVTGLREITKRAEKSCRIIENREAAAYFIEGAASA